MHELALAESVLRIIEESAARERFTRVKTVWLEIGSLAGVEPEAMRFCFDAVMRGSVAGDAALQIVEVPGTGWCMTCGDTVALAERWGECPRCHGGQVQATGGMEMRVKELEVD